MVDNTGRTSLSWAAQRGDSNAVEKLLKRGANPNRPDNSLRTPLHWSVAAQSNVCMILLLQNDATLNAKDDYGRTTLSSASSKKEERSFLEALLRFDADIHIEDNEGWAPLHWAAHKDKPNNISLLLNSGADIDATDKIGRNPMHAAMLRNCHRAIKVLLEKDAGRAPSRTALGSTTLHIAADYGDIETLTLLQAADLGDLDIEAENNYGLTAQKIAEGRRNSNEGWAESTCQERDVDPGEWYEAWETFMNKLVKRSKTRDARAERDSMRNKEPSESDSSDWETIEEGDGKEVWENALEATDGCCSPGSIVRDSSD